MTVTDMCSDFSVTSRTIHIDDLKSIADAGFKSILCTRPDGEDTTQTNFATIAKAADALGIECRQIEVFGHLGISQDNVAAFVDAWEKLPRPIFGYCRSGNRVATLYQITANMR